jgi:CRISPR/Cas system-associated endonuclease Cas1
VLLLAYETNLVFCRSYDDPAFQLEGDLAKIEKNMHKLVKQNLKIERSEMSRDDAVQFFTDKGEHYKAEIIASIPKTPYLVLLLAYETNLVFCRSYDDPAFQLPPGGVNSTPVLMRFNFSQIRANITRQKLLPLFLLSKLYRFINRGILLIYVFHQFKSFKFGG